MIASPASADTRPGAQDEPLHTALDVALHAGQVLLVSGADTYRVEETVTAVGVSLGAQAMEVYATPTGIIATAGVRAAQQTRVRRGVVSGVDLGRIEAVNTLARRIVMDGLEAAEVEAELDMIARVPRHYGPLVTTTTIALACGCFGLLFGGSWRDGVVALLAATVGMVTRLAMIRSGVGVLLHVPLTAFVATALVTLIDPFFGPPHYDITVPSAVLMLVPGVPLITALSDLVANDFVSGVTRLAQAVLVATEIAFGVALALAVARIAGWGG
jgi:uncharacterized membrane protein YjjP (DUF1212 family)